MSNCYVNDFTPTVKTYFKELKKYNPISKSEEKMLMQMAKNNDKFAKDKILTSNLRFVFDTAKKYKECGVPLEDLISEGNLGLIHAFDKFDEKRDVKFISYAVWWINYYIKDFIERRNVSKNIEVSDEELIKPQINNSSIQDDEDEVVLESENEMPNTEDIELNELNAEQKELVTKLLNKLDLRERSIVENYFGLGNKKALTLKECGIKLGLSQERIRQVKKKSLLKLRSELLLLSKT